MAETPTFDVAGARAAGASDDDILQHLTASRNYDVAGALKAGASKADVIDYLAKTPKKGAPQQNLATATIDAGSKPEGIQANVADWLTKLESDVKYGGGQTFAGKLLQVMGAKGTKVGAQGNIDDSLSPASMVTGPIKTAQGVAEGDAWKTVKGIAEAATIPASFAAPPAGNAIPDANRAGNVIGEIERLHGQLPVNPQQAERIAAQAKELKRMAGYQLPSVITGFLRRISDPAVLTVEDARKIYSSASGRLSVDEAAKIKPVMRRQLAMFAQKLGEAINDALVPVGQSERYMDAITEYHRAKAFEDATKTAIKVGAAGVAGHALLKGGMEAFNKLTR